LRVARAERTVRAGMSTLEVTTWSLQMHALPARFLRALPSELRLEQLEAPSAHFYRYLYETVGREWLWNDRRVMGDAELLAIVRDPRVEVWVAYADGAPAGYFELDRRVEGEVELAYFGLMPESLGRGWGKELLDAAIGRAFAQPTRRVWVHTCSLDHPRALPAYEAAGFMQFEVAHHTALDPRPLPVSVR
jgi:ribosomal protein S18 acetylase RimI-like enzyme